MEDERQFIEIENLNGELQKVEIFAEINSKRDDKTYVLITPDENIGDEVNMEIGYVYEENGRMVLELVENELKACFFDNKTKLGILNDEKVLTLTDNIMQKYNIILTFK